MSDKSDHFTVRQAVKRPQPDSTDPEEAAAHQRDLDITDKLGQEMRASGPYRTINRREGGLDNLRDQFNANSENQVVFLSFKNDKPTGMLAGNVSYLFSMDYILAICIFLYVSPAERDGKSAALLMTAFRQWAEMCKADELRFVVTSVDNIEKSHKMFTEVMNFAYLGGNYAWPLSEKGKQVLGELQPSSQKNNETH